MIYAALHLYFMRRVCKAHFGDHDILEIRVIGMISTVFLAVGTAFLFSYFNTVAQYILILILLCVVLVYRKKSISQSPRF